MSAVVNLEDVLTWSEANKLRIIVTDYRRTLHAELLLAREEGTGTRVAEARHKDAVCLDRKVDAMFRRLSEAVCGEPEGERRGVDCTCPSCRDEATR